MLRYCQLSFLILLSAKVLCQDPSEQEIANLEKARFQAMVNKDSVSLSRILADDLVYTHTNGALDTKSSFIKTIMEGNLVYYSIDPQEIRVRLFGKTALIHGLAHVKVKGFGSTSPIDMTISYLDVYYQDRNGWQLKAWQSSRLNR